MKDDRERLLDMLEAVERVERYTQRGCAAFERDELIQTWVVHHLQIVGEAAARLRGDGLPRRAPSTVPYCHSLTASSRCSGVASSSAPRSTVAPVSRFRPHARLTEMYSLSTFFR